MMGSKLFEKYMNSIEAKYKKSNLAMLKSALMANKNFLDILKEKHKNMVQAFYNRSAEKLN